MIHLRPVVLLPNFNRMIWVSKGLLTLIWYPDCYAATQLPQSSKYSKSADLLRKSLLSTLRFGRCKTNIHWMFCTSCLAGHKFKSLIVQARTASWPIAILQNTAPDSIHQSVKYCVRNLCRASARLQISSLSFALCQIASAALFYWIAINYTTRK